MFRSVLQNYLAPQSGNAYTLYCITLCFCNSRPCVVFLVTVPLPFAVDTDFNCQYTACSINLVRIYSRGAARVNTDKILGCLSTRRYPPQPDVPYSLSNRSHSLSPSRTICSHLHSQPNLLQTLFDLSLNSRSALAVLAFVVHSLEASLPPSKCFPHSF